MSRLEAMTIETAAQTSTKRKKAPKEDEGEDEGDDSGSDGGSDVVCLPFSFTHLLYPLSQFGTSLTSNIVRKVR